MEVCNLNELHYPLAKSQGELTTVQKLFLFKAYPLFNKIIEDNRKGNKGSSENTYRNDNWEREYRQLLAEKRKEMGRNK